ncbi:hypothetical protein EIP86_008247 [Pleurotus ostreatoroseus]|nr:hypothetical protein EIP86_008247 [Pleurotus ostreatoroseus]
MGSYYPSHSGLQSLPSHPEVLFSQPAVHDVGGHLPEDGPSVEDDTAAATRFCSVRGCSTALPYDYPHKMCELCRSRHRTYASTKRAKRKQEKAMLGAQAGMVWMPDGDDVSTQPAASASPMQGAGPENAHAGPSAPIQYTFAPSDWDTSALDPRLFQPQSSSSELAGALSMPVPLTSNRFGRTGDPQPSQSLVGQPVVPLSTTEDATGLALPSNSTQVTGHEHMSSTPSSTGSQHSHSILHPKGVISAQRIEEAAAQMEGSLPPRYCSIKGCKTVIPGDSFFKMCEPCRDRYRNYGTTKRKKWKKEKEEAIAEMEKMREEENKRRVESGLSIDAQIDWPNEPGPPHPNLPPGNAPRMCTVSHCREILPGGYLYLRCERHRIQNRHHSKLKRVRDKESKAMAEEEWAASVGAQIGSTRHSSEEHDGPLFDEDDDEHASLFRDDSSPTHPLTMFELQGIPPPARGTRRTNHVCSIKPCFNLLSPSTPWKMCDTCRARDREARRIKALRDSGIMVDPLPPRVTREKKEKKKKSKSKETTSPVDTPVEGAPLVFMDPLLPEGLDQPPITDYPDAPGGSLSFVLADEEGNITEPPAAIIEAEPPAPAESAPAKQKRSKRKAKATEISTPTPVAQAPQPPPPMMALPPIDPLVVPPPPSIPPPTIPLPTAPLPGPDRPPQQFTFPYYVPPYVMSPYSAPPGVQYPYGMPGMPPPGYPRDMYPPPPMYAPPYAPYAPYPPPFPYSYTYSRPPDAPAPPPSTVPVAPPPQQAVSAPQPPMNAMMSTFSARVTSSGPSREPSQAQSASTYAQHAAQRKRKQPAEQDEANAEKRAQVAPPAGDEGAIAPDPVPAAPNPNPTPDPGRVGQAQMQPVEQGLGSEVQVVAQSEQRVQCSNKSCHRTLSASSTSTLCDRCRERMKKKAMKVKQRYKLEPRKLAASTGHDHDPHSTSDDERGSVERQV